jgi:hypothetical protein
LVSSGRPLGNRKKVEAEVIPYREGKRNGEPKSGEETEPTNRKKRKCTDKWGNTIIGINIVSSLPNF